MKYLRLLLFPFALIYGVLMLVRNLLFDFGIFSSKKFAIRSIGVGNLSVGGTGKSVVVTYLIDLFPQSINVATLSRGYGRRTKGLRVASEEDTASSIGDEPFQFYKRYPNLQVVVSEKRVLGMKAIEKLNPKPDLVVMDDVMQHRWVKPDLMIMATDYKYPYFKDWVLPAGRLRELHSGVKRADLVLVTRSPKDLSNQQKEAFLKKIKTNIPVFFTGIRYAKGLFQANGNVSKTVLTEGNFILVTGIADPSHLINYLEGHYGVFDHLKFPDHHHFSINDIQLILNSARDKLILTTEKDYGRLSALLDTPKLHYLKIDLDFIFDQERMQFDEIVKNKI